MPCFQPIQQFLCLLLFLLDLFTKQLISSHSCFFLKKMGNIQFNINIKLGKDLTYQLQFGSFSIIVRYIQFKKRLIIKIIGVNTIINMKTLIKKYIPIYSFALQVQVKRPRRLIDRQPPRQKILTNQDRNIQYNPFQALQLARLHTFTAFPQTVDICIKLGVNPKNGQQIVRGSAPMPSGLGKQVKIAVLCDESMRQKAAQMGASIFIDNQLLKQIQNGNTPFDKLFCTPQMLPKLKAFGKILGPRGLMPNAKVGTLSSGQVFFNSIKQANQGQVTFRVDSGRNLHAPLGKLSFTDQQLLINFKSLMLVLSDKKPQSLKGKYFKQAFLKTTMGPRWRIKLNYIDPKHSQNIWNLID